MVYQGSCSSSCKYRCRVLPILVVLIALYRTPLQAVSTSTLENGGQRSPIGEATRALKELIVQLYKHEQTKPLYLYYTSSNSLHYDEQWEYFSSVLGKTRNSGNYWYQRYGPIVAAKGNKEIAEKLSSSDIRKEHYEASIRSFVTTVQTSMATTGSPTEFKKVRLIFEIPGVHWDVVFNSSNHPFNARLPCSPLWDAAFSSGGTNINELLQAYVTFSENTRMRERYTKIAKALLNDAENGSRVEFRNHCNSIDIEPLDWANMEIFDEAGGLNIESTVDAAIRKITRREGKGDEHNYEALGNIAEKLRGMEPYSKFVAKIGPFFGVVPMRLKYVEHIPNARERLHSMKAFQEDVFSPYFPTRAFKTITIQFPSIELGVKGDAQPMRRMKRNSLFKNSNNLATIKEASEPKPPSAAIERPITFEVNRVRFTDNTLKKSELHNLELVQTVNCGTIVSVLKEGSPLEALDECFGESSKPGSSKLAETSAYREEAVALLRDRISSDNALEPLSDTLTSAEQKAAIKIKSDLKTGNNTVLEYFQNGEQIKASSTIDLKKPVELVFNVHLTQESVPKYEAQNSAKGRDSPIEVHLENISRNEQKRLLRVYLKSLSYIRSDPGSLPKKAKVPMKNRKGFIGSFEINASSIPFDPPSDARKVATWLQSSYGIWQPIAFRIISYARGNSGYEVVKANVMVPSKTAVILKIVKNENAGRGLAFGTIEVELRVTAQELSYYPAIMPSSYFNPIVLHSERANVPKCEENKGNLPVFEIPPVRLKAQVLNKLLENIVAESGRLPVGVIKVSEGDFRRYQKNRFATQCATLASFLEMYKILYKLLNPNTKKFSDLQDSTWLANNLNLFSKGTLSQASITLKNATDQTTAKQVVKACIDAVLETGKILHKAPDDLPSHGTKSCYGGLMNTIGSGLGANTGTSYGNYLFSLWEEGVKRPFLKHVASQKIVDVNMWFYDKIYCAEIPRIEFLKDFVLNIEEGLSMVVQSRNEFSLKSNMLLKKMRNDRKKTNHFKRLPENIGDYINSDKLSYSIIEEPSYNIMEALWTEPK